MSSSRPDAGAAPRDALATIDVAVLAGGLGTRLRAAIGATPKVLAPVAGRPFLDHLLDWLAAFGARRVVLCLGFRSDMVLERLAASTPRGIEVVPSVEPKPLGTAGALRLALPLLRSDPVLVMNGDTFVDANLEGFVAAHRRARSAASVLSTTVPSMARYGRLDIDDAGRIRRFAEKDPSDTGPGPINAGLYLFSRAWLVDFASGTGESLERDVFAAAAPGTFLAVPAGDAAFVDIGTPPSLAEADSVIPRALARRTPAATVARA